MNKILKLVIIVFLSINGSADCQFFKRVNIGAQYWRASQNYYHEGLGINIAEQAGNLLGPDLSLQFGKIAVGSSMFFGSFSWLMEGVNAPIEVNVQRNQINFSLGLVYMEDINFFITVQNLSFEGEKSHSDLENRDYRTNVEDKGTLYGGGFSGVYMFPQSNVFALTYASYSLGHMKTVLTQYLKDTPIDELGGNWEYHSDALSVMLGLGYQFDTGINILLSYRQDINKKETGELELDGFILTFFYLFPPRE